MAAAETPEEVPESEPVRPVTINLEGQSFSDGGDGPTFNRGDTLRGGRPDRRSVDPDDQRRAVDPSEVAANESPRATEPTPEGRPRRRGPRNRDARLRAGVEQRVPYPDDAREAGVEAVCVAALRIDEQGRVAEIEAVSCDADGFGFAESFRRHIEDEFRFDPQIENRVAVERRLRWEHTFRLDD